MSVSTQTEPASTEQMLAGLGLAIYEAELVRAFVKSSGLDEKLETNKSASRQLLLLNREIELLKAKLTRVRGMI